MTESWDWKTNITELQLKKFKNQDTGTYPPSLIRGGLYQGLDDDSRVYLLGGTTSLVNESFAWFAYPDSSAYSLWSYDTETRDWEQALWAVIPRRKFQEGKRRGKGDQEEGGSQGEGQENQAIPLEGDEEHPEGDLVHADTPVENDGEEAEGNGYRETTWTTMDPDGDVEVPDEAIDSKELL